MPKDVVIDSTRRIKKASSCCSNSENTDEPDVNYLTHTKLFPFEPVRDGDEYFAAGKWHPAAEHRIGMPALTIFTYRRPLFEE